VRIERIGGLLVDICPATACCSGQLDSGIALRLPVLAAVVLVESGEMGYVAKSLALMHLCGDICWNYWRTW
jgi:hypothetical protein